MSHIAVEYYYCRTAAEYSIQIIFLHMNIYCHKAKVYRVLFSSQWQWQWEDPSSWLDDNISEKEVTFTWEPYPRSRSLPVPSLSHYARGVGEEVKSLNLMRVVRRTSEARAQSSSVGESAQCSFLLWSLPNAITKTAYDRQWRKAAWYRRSAMSFNRWFFVWGRLC